VRRALISRVALGIALSVAAFVLELGLDEVVGARSWSIAPFVAVLLAALAGGTASGGSAAIASWGLSSLLLPRMVDTEPLRPILEGINVGVAFVVGSTLGPRRQRAAAGPRIAHLPPASRALAALTATIDELAGPRSAVQVGDALARGLRQLTGADGVAIYLRADGPEPWTIRARTGDVGTGLPERIHPTNGDLISEAARSGRWVQSANQLAIPIVIGPDPVGVAVLVGLGAVEPQTRTVIGALARLASEAFERERLRSGRRAALNDATGATARIASFNRLASQLAGAVTVERVGELVVEHAVSSLRAEFGLLYVHDPRDGTCRLVHARGYPVGLVERESVVPSDGDGPVSRVARTRQAVEIDSPQEWRSVFPSSSDLPAMTGTRSLVAIPLGDAERLDGVLIVAWALAGAPSDADREALATIADQGGQALERARLHEQEREAHRMQDAFISVISHELRTPITTILAGSRLLRRRVAGQPDAEDLAQDIEAESDRLFRIVEDLLVLSRLERHNLSIADEPVHLTRLVDRVVASEARRWPSTTFVAPEHAGGVRVARGEETYIEQILRNLLSNAAKYAPSGSTVRVEFDEAGDEILVRVLDEGPGIARSEVEQLFTLFYRSPATAATAAGAGIGLFVSRRLADEMGGRMWARARPEGGSEFGFSVAAFPIDDPDDPLDEPDPPAEGVPSATGPAGVRS
jgi:signal transduction histidine kinase